jgi:hypothetical protein
MFDWLQAVPKIDGTTADVSVYPARRGFEDLLMVISDDRVPLAFTAVTFPKQRYAYFALRDPKVLRSTVFWLSNAGRHYAPWNSRHAGVMGVEDVTGHFHDGLAKSAAKNAINQAGYPTAIQLSPKAPTVVNYIMAIALLPAGFDRIERIEPTDDGRGVTLLAANGKQAKTAVDVDFVHFAVED